MYIYIYTQRKLKKCRPFLYTLVETVMVLFCEEPQCFSEEPVAYPVLGGIVSSPLRLHFAEV